MARDFTRTIRTTIPRGKVKFFGDVGAREFGGEISNPSTDRMSDIVEPSGCDYAAFLRAGTILAQHDALLPIAKPLSIDVRSDRIYMRGTFPEPGVSDVADQYCRLVKAGILNSFSIGFLPRRWEPIKGGFGLRFIEWELLEVSIVSVPALSSALITERSFHGAGGESTADRLVRAVARKDRIEGREGLMRVHQCQPPPALTPEQELAEANRKRYLAGYAAAQSALGWW